MSIDYSESIIVPLSIFEKCQFRESFQTQPSLLQTQPSLLHPSVNPPLGPLMEPPLQTLANISLLTDAQKISQQQKDKSVLYRDDVPSDVKLKLYQQEQKLTKKPKTTTTVRQDVSQTASQIKQNDVTSFVNTFNAKQQPLVASILAQMLKYPSKIAWNDRNEIVIDGNPIKESNVIELLNYTMGRKVITKDGKDIPEGGIRFIETLSEIGVPREWIKAPSRRSTRVRKQTGTGYHRKFKKICHWECF